MRPRLVAIVVILIGFGISILFYLDNSQKITPETVTDSRQNTPLQNETQNNATSSSDRPVKQLNDSASHRNIMDGLLIDDANRAIPAADILFRFIAQIPNTPCEDMQDINFELNASTFTTQTDNKGLFHASVPENFSLDGQCLIIDASKSGYHSTTVGLDTTTISGTIEIELQKHGQVLGTVISPQSSPAANSVVTSWIANTTNDSTAAPCAKVDSSSVTSASADSDGKFQLEAIGSSIMCLQASHDQWASSLVTSVDLTAIRDGIVLTLLPAVSLKGQVLNHQGAPVGNLTLELQSTDTARAATDNVLRRTARSNANGEFVFSNLDNIEYQLTSTDANYAVAKPRLVALDKNHDLDNLQVEVYPVTIITGKIVDEFGNPVAQAQVSSRSPLLPDQSLASTYTNDNGEFTLASQHRANNVMEMLEMLAQAPDQSARDYSTAATCLSIYHPDFVEQNLALTSEDAQLSMGTLHLISSENSVKGIVKNHRNEAITASLSFTFADGNSAAPSTDCSKSTAPKTIKTNDAGEFQFSVESTGTYEVEVATERYQTRRMSVVITDSATLLEIKLD